MSSSENFRALTKEQIRDRLHRLTEEESTVSARRQTLHSEIDALRRELVDRLRDEGGDVIAGDDPLGPDPSGGRAPNRPMPRTDSGGAALVEPASDELPPSPLTRSIRRNASAWMRPCEINKASVRRRGSPEDFRDVVTPLSIRESDRLCAILVSVYGIELPGARFEDGQGVQVGLRVKDEIENPVSADLDDARWQADIRVREMKPGYDFTGPAVRGRRGERFLALAWTEDEDGEIFRALKIRLDRLPADLVCQALRGDVGVRATIRLTDDQGGPLCATAPSSHLAWALTNAA